MNEEVAKSITNTMDGFQWVLSGLAILLILYLILKSFRKKK